MLTSLLTALCFRLVVILLASVFVVAFFVTSILLSPIFLWTFFSQYFFKKFNSPPILSRKSCDNLEAQLVETRKFSDPNVNTRNVSIVSDWMSVKVNLANGTCKNFEIHSIVAESKSKDGSLAKPILLWIHGVGGTAVMSFVLSGIIDRIADDFDVYAIDLPGMGRSTADPFFKEAPGSIPSTYTEILRSSRAPISPLPPPCPSFWHLLVPHCSGFPFSLVCRRSHRGSDVSRFA